ncbi:hypothetical protein [Helicobacter sp. 13S00482-2]|uniref:hypothetical protein n=1 Tax=Helicobacter sp. 13S00482-2 TaxID=1476200 RepID=UPI0015DAB9B5|nr:hypothetical protein [Helicobacter sp. 13S00482-2]
MEMSTLTTISGWAIGIVGVFVTIMAVFIAVYGIYFQKSLSSNAKREILENTNNKLN